MSSSVNKMFGGILLVAGTQIGAGMLALPLNHWNRRVIWRHGLTFLACFLYMLTSLFLLLEANTYDDDQSTNIIGMAKRHLGKTAEHIAWVCFMLLMYAALSAYISGASEIINSVVTFVPILVTDAVRIFLIAFAFGGITFLGTCWIDQINRVLMFGLAFSYITMITTLLPHIQASNLTHNYTQYIPAAIPVVILSFTSHIILLSLREYLDNDIAQLKRVPYRQSYTAIDIPFVGAYYRWHHPTSRRIRHAEYRVQFPPHPIANLSQAIAHKVGNNILGQNNNLFAFCALTTSMLGVLLSLRDFLADGFHANTQTNQNAFLLIVLCLQPPTLLYFTRLIRNSTQAMGVFIAIYMVFYHR